MTPKKDGKGNVTVELTSTEEKRLRAAWGILDQIAYHLHQSASYKGVTAQEADQAAIVVDRLTKPE